MTIADAASDVGEEAIIKAVAATGMRATPWPSHSQSSQVAEEYNWALPREDFWIFRKRMHPELIT